jgi:hypothetical protein
MEENIRFFEVVEELKSRGVLSDYIQLAGVLETNKAGVSDLKNGRKSRELEVAIDEMRLVLWPAVRMTGMKRGI